MQERRDIWPSAVQRRNGNLGLRWSVPVESRSCASVNKTKEEEKQTNKKWATHKSSGQRPKRRAEIPTRNIPRQLVDLEKKNGAPKGGERDTTPFSIYSRPLQMAVISRTTRQPPAVKKRHQIRRSTSDVAARPRPFPIFFFWKLKKKNKRPSIN